MIIFSNPSMIIMLGLNIRKNALFSMYVYSKSTQFHYRAGMAPQISEKNTFHIPLGDMYQSKNILYLNCVWRSIFDSEYYKL